MANSELVTLGDASAGGSWMLQPVEIEWEFGDAWNLAYRDSETGFVHVYEQLGPLADTALIIGGDKREAIIDHRYDLVERVLLHEGEILLGGVPKVTPIMCLGDGSAYSNEIHIEHSAASWRWKHQLLVGSSGGLHYAFDTGRVNQLGERISAASSMEHPSMGIVAMHPLVWSSLVVGDELHLGTGMGSVLVTVRRASEPFPEPVGVSQPGLEVLIWDHDGSSGSSAGTGDEVDSVEYVSQDDNGTQRMVRQFLAGDDHVEIEFALEPHLSPGICAMTSMVADAMMVHRTTW